MAVAAPPLSQIFPPENLRPRINQASVPAACGMGSFGSVNALACSGGQAAPSLGMHNDEAPIYRPPVRVLPPHPKTPGGVEFYGAVPKKDATFAWSELCATPGPEASLAPVPQIPMKSWYNSYVYLPEQNSHDDRQFLQRYVKGPNGTWVDVIKARRLVNSMEEQREKQMRQALEREMVLSGAGVQKTHYVDAYSGKKMVACRGELVTEKALYEEYHVHQGNVLDQDEVFDFDNLRFPWPFAHRDVNKPVSQFTYDWFDRRNMYIPTDRSCEIVELSSMYVDQKELERWWHDDLGPSPSSGTSTMPQPRAQEVML